MKSVKEMTLHEKIGQLIFVGFKEPEYNFQAKVLIEEFKVGNIILFARNVRNVEQLSGLTHQLHAEIKKQTGIMPLIAIDQEGGMVTRIQDKATLCPGQMTLTATDVKNSYKTGEIVGDELAHLGISINLAPSLDTNNNLNNPVIGVRSYSDDPKKVAECGANYIKGLQSKGIIAACKHFPGHGDVEVDSHLGLGTVSHNKERLHEVELYPFKKAIESGVEAVMTAHLVFKAYDKKYPATLSSTVLNELLRGELGFKGLVISDSMEMKAIDNTYTTERGAIMGLKAGLDMFFVCHSLEKQIATLEAIEEAIINGELDEAEIDKKVEKVLKFKEKIYPIIAKKFLNNPDSLSFFDDDTRQKESQSIVDQSLTLVSGKKLSLFGKVLFIGANPIAVGIAEDTVNKETLNQVVAKNLPNLDVVEFIPSKYDEELIEKAKTYDTVVFVSFNAFSNREQARMINKMGRTLSNLFVISIRNPYDYLVLNDVKNFATLYEYTPNSVNTIVKYLKGEIEPTGKPSVNLVRRFNVGASIYVGMKEYTFEENKKYMDMLKQNGINLVFISAHELIDKPECLKELEDTLDYAKQIGLKVVMDVYKKLMEKMSIPTNVYALRLDYGFSPDEIIELSNNGNYLIELNASSIKTSDVLELINKGASLSRFRISHNFYPKPFTGLSQESILEKNKFFKELGFNISAFVPSSSGKRGPIYDGLPTCEEHRYMDLNAILSEMAMLGVDEVSFGDAYVSKEELKQVASFDKDELLIPIELNEKVSKTEIDLLKRTHTNRIDVSPYLLRSSIRINENIKPFNNCKRNRKDVTIDNVNFDRYQGEISIIKKDLPQDDRVNVVGRALVSDWFLENIKPNQRFKFIIKK